MSLKNTILYFFICLVFEGYSQQNSLEGYVVLQNSRTDSGILQYVSFVTIDSEEGYCKSQITDSRGYFKLICSGLKSFNKLKLKIQKTGYEVINQKEISESSFIGNPYPIRIVLGRTTQIEKDFQNYYKFLEDYFITKKDYKKYVNSSLNVIEKMKVKEIALLNKVDDLKETNFDQSQKIQEIANELARINLDDLEEDYRVIYELMTRGDFQGALNQLSEINFEARLSNANKKKSKIQKTLDEDLKALLQRARLKYLSYDYIGAINDLEIGVKEDSKNIDFLLELAYVHQISNSLKSVFYYNKVLKYEKDTFRISAALNNLGVIYRKSREMDKAEEHLSKALSIREILYQRDEAKGNYINTLNSYSNLLAQIGEHDKAMEKNNMAVEISHKLYVENDSIYFLFYFESLLTKSNHLIEKGDNQSVLKLYVELGELLEKRSLEKLDIEFILAFYLKYGSFYQYKMKNGQQAFELYKKGALFVENRLDYLKTYYGSPDINSELYIPVLLGFIYQNAAKLQSDPRHKEEFFLKSLKIFGSNFSKKDSFGLTYLSNLIGLKCDYSIFLLKNKKDTNAIQTAYKNINSSKSEIRQYDSVLRKYRNLGDLYGKIGNFYFVDKQIDSAKLYITKQSTYVNEIIDNTNYQDLINSSKIKLNLANLYLLGEKDKKKERIILKTLLSSQRRLKKFKIKDEINIDHMNYLDEIINFFKKDIVFGEPREVKVQISY